MPRNTKSIATPSKASASKGKKTTKAHSVSSQTDNRSAELSSPPRTQPATPAPRTKAAEDALLSSPPTHLANDPRMAASYYSGVENPYYPEDQSHLEQQEQMEKDREERNSARKGRVKEAKIFENVFEDALAAAERGEDTPAIPYGGGTVFTDTAKDKKTSPRGRKASSSPAAEEDGDTSLDELLPVAPTKNRSKYFEKVRTKPNTGKANRRKAGSDTPFVNPDLVKSPSEKPAPRPALPKNPDGRKPLQKSRPAEYDPNFVDLTADPPVGKKKRVTKAGTGAKKRSPASAKGDKGTAGTKKASPKQGEPAAANPTEPANNPTNDADKDQTPVAADPAPETAKTSRKRKSVSAPEGEADAEPASPTKRPRKDKPTRQKTKGKSRKVSDAEKADPNVAKGRDVAADYAAFRRSLDASMAKDGTSSKNAVDVLRKMAPGRISSLWDDLHDVQQRRAQEQAAAQGGSAAVATGTPVDASPAAPTPTDNDAGAASTGPVEEATAGKDQETDTTSPENINPSGTEQDGVSPSTPAPKVTKKKRGRPSLRVQTGSENGEASATTEAPKTGQRTAVSVLKITANGKTTRKTLKTPIPSRPATPSGSSEASPSPGTSKKRSRGEAELDADADADEVGDKRPSKQHRTSPSPEADSSTGASSPSKGAKAGKGDLDSKTVPELKALCKDRGIKGYSRLRKPALIGALMKAGSESGSGGSDGSPSPGKEKGDGADTDDGSVGEDQGSTADE